MASFTYIPAPRHDGIFRLTGVLGENYKIYFYMSDVVVMLNKDSVFELKYASCQLKDVCSLQMLSRPDAWVIEFHALRNLLGIMEEWDLFDEFKYGHVKVKYHRNKIPELTSCKWTEGIRFKNWLYNLQTTVKKALAKINTRKSPKPLRL